MAFEELRRVVAECKSETELETFLQLAHLMRALLVVADGYVGLMMHHGGMTLADALAWIDALFDEERRTFKP